MGFVAPGWEGDRDAIGGGMSEKIVERWFGGVYEPEVEGMKK